MRKKLLYIIPAVFLSCNSADNNATKIVSASEQIICEWNNLSIKVEINSKNNSESNEVFQVDRLQWEEKLQIKPIRTFFTADSTWTSSYYNLQDSLVGKSSGKWWTKESKLTMLQLIPSVDTTVYTFGISNDTASFEGMIDWDSDGKKDDKYFGKQIKVKS